MNSPASPPILSTPLTCGNAALHPPKLSIQDPQRSDLRKHPLSTPTPYGGLRTVATSPTGRGARRSCSVSNGIEILPEG